ncbi:MAG: histone deacetylase [Rickettsiales bacterium]|nr:histone deacetylase [Rickettsiales bacterium]
MLRIAWSPEYNLELPPGHRFPMIKYDLIKEHLLYEGVIEEKNLFKPVLVADSDFELTHDPKFLGRLKSLEITSKEIRKIGFPLSNGLVLREFLIASGTVQCCDHARAFGVSLNIAGGTHHAYYDYGEGFCILNDQAIAANILLSRNIVSKILIVDLDVHQGNGTAKLFENEPRVFTMSFHGAKNYPFKKEHSDLDVAFDDDTGDDLYLSILEASLNKVFNDFEPDFVFYQSGVDGLSNDKLEKLSLTVDGLKTRDNLVLSHCQKSSVPVVVSMGGGYSSSLYEIVEAHVNTFRVARELYD